MRTYKNDKGLMSDYDEDLRYWLFLENYRTGVVSEPLPIYGEDRNKNYKILTPTQLKAIEKRKEKRQWHDPDQENFVWFVFEAAATLTEIVPEEYLAALFLLGTYASYEADGMLTSHGAPVKKAKLPELLGMSRQTAGRFWKCMAEDNNILREKDGVVHMDRKVFFKGPLGNKVKRFSKENRYITKVLTDSVRDLYKRATPRTRKQLGYLFQCLPFANVEYNIICKNPQETEPDNIELMTVGELCDLVGYDKSNSARLIQNLKGLEFSTDKMEKPERAANFVLGNGLRDSETYQMFINPKVAYRGHHPEEVRVLGLFGQRQ